MESGNTAPNDKPDSPSSSSSSGAVLGTGIELAIRNLSVSVIPPSSLLVRVARKLRITSSPQKSRDVDGTVNPLASVDSESRSRTSDVVLSNITDRDLRNVSINIFRHVDLTVKPGQVCIILGGSGSGKTTLLNSIAGRMIGPEILISGSIQCNGVNANWDDGSVGYLQQYDFLMPFLTVRETLTYAAHLRLPRTMSKQKKLELVEFVLLELGLKDCADTQVGDPGGGENGSSGIRGISGGERRRVSAGVQLLTNPKMLLCDEVTSGLDAFSSYEVMKSLTHLAQSTQKTIVISIHQPRSEIFRLLSESDGQMVLLSRGDVVYSGPVRSVLSWIESTGIRTCPSGVNPFDYLLDLSMIDFASEAFEKATAIRRNLLVEAWAARRKEDSLKSSTSDPSILTRSGDESSAQAHGADISSPVSLAVDFIPRGDGPSLWSQIWVLTSRGWRNQIRDSLVLWVCVGECVVMGLAMGAMYYQLDDSLAGIRARSSLVYGVGGIQAYQMLMILVYRLSQDIMIYDRERMDHWYGPLPYLISSCLHSTPFNVLYPIVFAAITYYLTGLRTDSLQHFGWWTLFIMDAVALAAGFFITSSSIPALLRWIQYPAYLNACYHILASNEFTDHRFDCPYMSANGMWDPVKCAPWDGNAILVGQLDVKVKYFPGPIVQMVYYFIGFLGVAWFALTVNVVNPTTMGHEPTLMDVFIMQAASIFSFKKRSAAEIRGSDSLASSKESLDLGIVQKGETRLDVFSKGLEQRNPVTIRVEGLGLSVSLNKFEWSLKGFMEAFHRGKTEKQLLKDVDAVFPAGELTAILGGSGAGKTSLMSVLLQRTSSNLNMTGSIYFNDTKNPSLRMINGVSSYVRQDDNYLLSHLTARETLQYAADLRMDSSISKADKHAKIEDIIDLLGLRECADVIVGSYSVKGCSGGERRPKAVVLTLKRIASSGRTVVCTIHQPRADIWHVFDNVVLLVTGGCAAYSGRADKVVEYFEGAGHVPPPFINVPDFIIDTASVNLRSAELEGKTREVVNALIDRFNDNKHNMLAHQMPSHPLGELPKANPQFASFTKAFPALTCRSFVNAFRQKGLYFNRILQPVIVSAIMAAFFSPLGNGPADVTGRLGLLQQAVPVLFAGIYNSVPTYPIERDIAYREISDGGYSATSFFFSYLVNELPLEVFSSLIVTFFMLVLTKMKVTVLTFFSFWIVMCGYVNAGESIGIIFSTFAIHAGFNITVMSAMISVFAVMGGFNALNLPSWLDAINNFSVIKYGTLIITRNEFDNKTFDCSAEQISTGLCPFPTGNSILDLLKLRDQNWNLYMGLFVTVVLLYRIVAWLVLVTKIKIRR
ncbi:hypothetical protein BGX28_010261, partial [Mortierella sp. GBA30]